MFGHVLRAATGSVPAAQVLVVSRSAAVLEAAGAAGAQAVREAGCGQNSALAQAAALVDQSAPLLALSADLPLLTSADLAVMLAELDETDVVAATDRVGTGTNALLLRRPGLITFAFGDDSLARHSLLTQASGLRFTLLHRPGLSADIDEPDDLALLTGQIAT